MGYTQNTIKGISWVGALRAATRGVSFLRSVILARLLIPSQFGAFGVATLVLSLLEVLAETGVNVILVQQKDTIDDHINSAWVISIFRGLIIGTIIYILAEPIGNFFHSGESILLLQLIAIVPVLRGFINPSVVKFQKELLFHKEFYYRFSIFTIDAGTAILVTFLTKSPVGIVTGLIAGVVFEIVLSFMVIKPTPRFVFEKFYLKKIISHGKWVTASGIFNYLFYNFDNIVVGRILGTGPLGLYQMAYSFSFLPISEVTDVFSKVTFPVYAKIREDKKRLKTAFLKTTGAITLLTLPIGMVLFFFPKETINIVLGPKWVGAAGALQVLAIFGVVRAISGSASALFLALGKQKYLATFTFVNIVTLAIIIVPFVMKFGIVGAGASALIGTLVSIPLIIYFVLKVL